MVVVDVAYIRLKKESKMKKTAFKINPIGYVCASGNRFCLKIDPDYIDGLKELAGFSFINVFWWCHQVDNDEYRKIVSCPKPYKKGPDEIGVFATRSPVRPNPIGVTAVSILDIEQENGIIQIPFIDAEDKSPIIDIKPYHPATDRIKTVSVPAWCAHWPKWYEDSATFDWPGEFENAQ